MVDNYVRINANGQDVHCSVYSVINDIYANFILQVETTFIDITSSFEIELPIAVQSADVTQQQAIARQVKNIQIDNSNWYRQQNERAYISNTIGNALKIGSSVGGSIAREDYFSAVSGLGSAFNLAGTAYSHSADYYKELENKQLERFVNNYEMYKTNSLISVSNDKLFSLYYGLCVLYVQPINENYVDSVLEITGYKTNKIVTDNSLLTTAQESKTYNIIKLNYEVKKMKSQKIKNLFLNLNFFKKTNVNS